MSFVNPLLTNYPGMYRPYTDITPFTYRSGMVYQEILENIRTWIPDTLLPNLDKSFTGIDAAIAAIQSDMETGLADLLTNILAGGSAGLLDSFLLPEQFVQTADNGDWALAITRALAQANPSGRPVLLTRKYAVASTITLNSGDRLVGLGHGTGIIGPVNAPVQMIAGTNISGIELANFTVDGNCLTQTVKNYTRAVQFITSNRIRFTNMRTQFTPDWATTFDRCSNIVMTNHSHEAGAAAQNGGRDGIHFLDSLDCLVDGARIHSGDDCIGITSKTRDISNITVRNVSGVSNIAAVVTVGNEGTTSFNASDITIENITTFNSLDYDGNKSQYIVKVRAQNSAKISRLTVSGVRGTSNTYAVYLEGNVNSADSFKDVSLSNVRAVSLTGHGVTIDRITNLTASNVHGEGRGTNFCGINLANITNAVLHAGGAANSGLWGVQVNGCTNTELWGLLVRENGGASFASNSGGNLRIVNSTGTKVYGGQYVGALTTSYWGASISSTSDTTTIPPTITGAH